MFEYELDSNAGNEERKNFDYDFSKEEFLNPILVKGPDGELSVGTEAKDRQSKEALCWNCNAHLIYRKGAKKVRCHSCKEINNMEANNAKPTVFVKC
jgi:LSD1 subclass zinc finger protein